ncbi:DUF5686 family protein [Bacteroidota bacterium]
MSRHHIIVILLGMGMFCTFASLHAQKTIVHGVVLDENDEPMSFVNVAFIHSTVGTITDINGTYFIETLHPTDSLVASSMGYGRQTCLVKKYQEQKIDFRLAEITHEIEEITIKPGENPAFRILRNIYARKKINNPDRFESYQCKSYNKLRLDLNNIEDEFKERLLVRQFDFVFEHMDSSEMFGKNYLPILMLESVTQYYYQKSPAVDKEVIEAFRISGDLNSTVSQFSGKMYQRLNVYDNFISLFEPGFISPIADFGKFYYKYHLEDSAMIDGSWCYQIAFQPRRKMERTFYGYFWVADTSWAIKKVQLRVSSDVNINYMNDLVAINEYQMINDSVWFLKSEEILIDFNLSDKSYGFFGRKFSSYEDIKFDQPVPDKIRKELTNTIVLEDSLERNELYWESMRPDGLSLEEEMIYQMVDSVKNVPIFKTIYGIGELLLDYYYVIGPVEIGPYYTFYSYNPIEGHRFRLGGRTSPNFSTKLRLGGHVAYGTKDNSWKYGVLGEYMFDNNPRIRGGASYYHDMRQLGKSDNAFLDDNILATLLRRRPNYKLTLVNQYNMFYEREWFHGFSNTLTFTHQVIYPTQYVPFEVIEANGTSPLGSLISSEFNLNFHFAYNEKFLLGKFERQSLGSIYPMMDLDLSWGPKGMFGSQYEYYKVKARVYDKVETDPVGYLKYWVTAGKIFGELPYPLLELHEGNETYAHDVYAFNMMNYYEFVSDEWVSLTAEHHFQGFFLNRIPLVRWLEFREVVGGKFLMGRLRDANKNVMVFPPELTYLGEPYMEGSIGIENILKLIRVDATWRFSYKDHPGIQKFGFRIGLWLQF